MRVQVRECYMFNCFNDHLSLCQLYLLHRFEHSQPEASSSHLPNQKKAANLHTKERMAKAWDARKASRMKANAKAKERLTNLKKANEKKKELQGKKESGEKVVREGSG
jgi:hypothetical protein